jgi:hypothetical protein
VKGMMKILWVPEREVMVITINSIWYVLKERKREMNETRSERDDDRI